MSVLQKLDVAPTSLHLGSFGGHLDFVDLGSEIFSEPLKIPLEDDERFFFAQTAVPVVPMLMGHVNRPVLDIEPWEPIIHRPWESFFLQQTPPTDSLNIASRTTQQPAADLPTPQTLPRLDEQLEARSTPILPGTGVASYTGRIDPNPCVETTFEWLDDFGCGIGGGLSEHNWEKQGYYCLSCIDSEDTEETLDSKCSCPSPGGVHEGDDIGQTNKPHYCLNHEYYSPDEQQSDDGSQSDSMGEKGGREAPGCTLDTVRESTDTQSKASIVIMQATHVFSPKPEPHAWMEFIEEPGRRLGPPLTHNNAVSFLNKRKI